MAHVEAQVKRFVKHLCGVYFGLPDPLAGGFALAGYARKINGLQLAQRIRAHAKAAVIWRD